MARQDFGPLLLYHYNRDLTMLTVSFLPPTPRFTGRGVTFCSWCSRNCTESCLSDDCRHSTGSAFCLDAGFDLLCLGGRQADEITSGQFLFGLLCWSSHCWTVLLCSCPRYGWRLLSVYGDDCQKPFRVPMFFFCALVRACQRAGLWAAIYLMIQRFRVTGLCSGFFPVTVTRRWRPAAAARRLDVAATVLP